MAKIDKALTIPEAARIKGVTRQALYWAMSKGKVKFIEALGHKGILPDDLAKYQPAEAKIGPRK